MSAGVLARECLHIRVVLHAHAVLQCDVVQCHVLLPIAWLGIMLMLHAVCVVQS